MNGYLLDEHLPRSWCVQLAHRVSVSVRFVGEKDAPPKGTSDPDLLKWCEAADFILVTEDRRTMFRHLADHLETGQHILGVFVLRENTPIRRIIEELQLLAEASIEGEYFDQIRFLPFE